MASFSGKNPLLAQYAKRKTSLCKDHFIHKFCTKGDSCHFAHKAPPNKICNATAATTTISREIAKTV